MSIRDIIATAPAEMGYAHAATVWHTHAVADGLLYASIEPDEHGRDQVVINDSGPFTLVSTSHGGQITVLACRRPSEIPMDLTDYPLLQEILDDIPGLDRELAHARIQSTLRERIARQGEDEVVYARRTQVDTEGQPVGQWVTVDTESYWQLYGAVTAWAEDDLGHLMHRLDEREDDIQVEVRHYRPRDIPRLADDDSEG